MELIILGIVLFIAGIAGTMFYDAYKAAKQKQAEMRAARPPRPVPAARKTRTLQDSNEEFLAKFAEHMKQQPAPRKRTRASVKIKTLSPEDFSTESALTVEELIAKLEAMKKKI